MAILASSFDQSRYFKAADLDRERKFRIKKVTVEEVGTGADKEKKLVVWFTNDERGLVLNKTNNRVLRGAFGDNVETWPGKIFVIFPTMVDNRGRLVPALRTRILPPKGNGQTAATSAQQTAPADPELDDDVKPPATVVKQRADDMDDEIPF
jgi:hypothetical protein